MADYPRILIDLEKIRHNARVISELASEFGIEVTGVTKATCGDPEVAKAMLEGGADSIADSRLSNIQRMKAAGIDSQFMLLRTPMLSQAKEVVKSADMSLNTELEVIRELDSAAGELETSHKVIIMLELGELREGVKPGNARQFIRDVKSLENIEIQGIGINLACLTGVVPTTEKMDRFGELVDQLQDEVDMEFEMVGGGNSANIPLLMEGKHNPNINNLRIGEAILLGLETVNRNPVPGTYQDAFILEAEIIELKEKPSVPDGRVSQNAFGETPEFQDQGDIPRAIVALGRQDVIVEGLKPLGDGLEIIASSSDHIVLNIKNNKLNIGDKIRFSMDYGALVHAFTSKYVKKRYL